MTVINTYDYLLIILPAISVWCLFNLTGSTILSIFCVIILEEQVKNKSYYKML